MSPAVARTLSIARSGWISFVVGGVMSLALLSAWPALEDAIEAATDRIFPVVSAEVRLITKLPDEVQLRATVRKHRGCERVSISAYSQAPDGVMQRAVIDRVHPPAQGEELGHMGSGEELTATWRIWPTTGAVGVTVYMQHRCGDRIVSTRLLGVSI